MESSGVLYLCGLDAGLVRVSAKLAYVLKNDGANGLVVERARAATVACGEAAAA
jgi:hypothetical protein